MTFRIAARLSLFFAICLGTVDASAQRQSPRDFFKRPDRAPKVGEDAPTFKLKSLDGKSETDLAQFKGKKPVVLIFGSYT